MRCVKFFLLLLNTYRVCLRVSLGSYLSNELHCDAERCLNPFLESQTCATAHFLYFHHHFETWFRGLILSKYSCILAKNAHFLIFEDVCGLQNIPIVFENVLNVFSDIKLTCNCKGLHWKTLFPKLIVILCSGTYFEPFVSV